MRILHTSDWHLGRSFGDFRLLDDQRQFLEWLVDLCIQREVELVAVAGDLFDRSVPPADAVALLRDTLRSFQAAQIEVVAIAGNHDSGDRLAAYDGLTEASGLLIRGGYERAAQVEVRNFSDGPLAIAAVPFLDPVLAPEGYLEPAESEGRLQRYSHEGVLRTCLDQIRSSVSGHARSLVLAHAFVAGGVDSTSERELSIGASSMVSASVFDGFSYCALGHLHRPQVVDKRPHVRYSGSPLAYSFSERKDSKEVVVVDLDPEGNASIESVKVPVGRRARLITDHFDRVMQHPGFDDDPFVRIELLDQTRIIDAHRRLRDKFPYLAEIAYIAEDKTATSESPRSAVLRELAPLAQVQAFWTSNAAGAMLPDQEALVIEVLEELQREEVGR